MEPNDLIKNLYINPIPDESKVIILNKFLEIQTGKKFKNKRNINRSAKQYDSRFAYDFKQ